MGRINDRRQLEMFGDAGVEDPVAVYYRKLKRIGATLTHDRNSDVLTIIGKRGGIPRWAFAGMLEHGTQIRRDLLRAEHGVTPQATHEQLPGGATLVRLPSAHKPELDPPVARPRLPQPQPAPRAPVRLVPAPLD